MGQLLERDAGARRRPSSPPRCGRAARPPGVRQMEASFANLQTRQHRSHADPQPGRLAHAARDAAGLEGGRSGFATIGITHYTVAALDELAAILRAERLDFVQLGYSLDVPRRRSPAAAARRRSAAWRSSSISLSTAASLFAQVRGKALPDVGSRGRLRQLGTVLFEVHPGPSGRDLRHSRHGKARACARQRRRRHGASARCRPAPAHERLLGGGPTLGFATGGGKIARSNFREKIDFYRSAVES